MGDTKSAAIFIIGGTGLVVAMIVAGSLTVAALSPQAPETVPCKCAKCSAQCCEVGK